MPFATCRSCRAVFIVSVEDEGGPAQICPYCGRGLEPLPADEARKRIERPLPEEGGADSGGISDRASAALASAPAQS
jgi:hypothetical protein